MLQFGCLPINSRKSGLLQTGARLSRKACFTNHERRVEPTDLQVYNIESQPIMNLTMSVR